MFLAADLLLIGNIIGGVGMVLFLISAILKTKNKILFSQTLSHIVNIVSEVVIGFVNPGSFTATIGEGINIIRNGFVIKNKNTKLVSIILLVVSTIVGVLVNVYFGGNTLIGYIPVVTTFVYSFVVLIPNVRVEFIKAAMIFSNICFSAFSFLIGNYTMGVGNVITCTMTIISLISIIISNKKMSDNPKSIE